MRVLPLKEMDKKTIEFYIKQAIELNATK